MNSEDPKIKKDPIDPQFQEFVDKLLQTLKEKDHEILSLQSENESLTSLLAFYREQFNMDEYSKTLENISTLKESLEIKSKELAENHQKINDFLSELTIKNKELADYSKKIEEFKRENRRLNEESKHYKSQFSTLEGKIAISQQLNEALKRENENLKQEKSSFAKENEDLKLENQALLQERQTLHSKFSKNSHNPKTYFELEYLQSTISGEISLEEELELFQRNLENLELFNSNIQGSLQQFQLTNPRNSRFFQNRSIDLSKNLLSPKSLAIKNPSIAFVLPGSQSKTSVGSNEMLIEATNSSTKHEENKELFHKKSDSHEEITDFAKNNRLFMGCETINEEEKDTEAENNERKSSLNIKKKSESNRKTTISRKKPEKCKSLNCIAALCENKENKDNHQRSKSSNFSSKILENVNLKDLLAVEKLDNDCYSILRVIFEALLSLAKDFQTKVCSYSRKTQGFLNTVNTETKQIRSFVKEINENYKDYTLYLADIIKLVAEAGRFIHKAHEINEAQEFVLHNQELEIKVKLEEIVKLHENIINFQKKEISFEENINEIYEKYMLVLEEKEREDHEKWIKLDLFKKFTRVIESLVQERMQARAQNREIEQMSNDIIDMQRKIQDLNNEIAKKNENLTKIGAKEKNIKKERDFLYSQLMFLRKKAVEASLANSSFEETKINYQNIEEINDIVRKLKGLEGSVRTVVDNLNVYEQNKEKK